MLDILWEVALGVGTLLLADKVTEEVTGKHIHEHIFEWWREIADEISAWLSQNSNIKVCRVMLAPWGYLNSILDEVFVSIYGRMPRTQIIRNKKLFESELSQEEITQLIHEKHIDIMGSLDRQRQDVVFSATAVDMNGDEYAVTDEKSVPLEEFVQQFPEFENYPLMVQEMNA